MAGVARPGPDGRAGTTKDKAAGQAGGWGTAGRHGKPGGRRTGFGGSPGGTRKSGGLNRPPTLPLPEAGPAKRGDGVARLPWLTAREPYAEAMEDLSPRLAEIEGKLRQIKEYL